MLFNSWEYLFLFLVTTILYFNISLKYRTFLLLISSYIFYISWRLDFAFLMLAVTMVNIFEQIESDYDNVKFINFTDAYSHRYELFYDPIHLNSVGQKVVTDSLIKNLQKNY